MLLKSIAQKYYAPDYAHFGPGAAMREIDVRALSTDLEKVWKSNGRLFWTCILLYLLLFVVQFVFLFLAFSEPVSPRLIGALVGATQVGLIERIIRFWRQKTMAEMLFAVLPSLDKKGLNDVLGEIVRGTMLKGAK